MISYKDKTFCLASTNGTCKNDKCWRFFSDEERANSIKWWGSDDAPVAFCDFSKDCEDLVE